MCCIYTRYSGSCGGTNNWKKFYIIATTAEICAENEHVNGQGICRSCPDGFSNDAGDNVTEGESFCEGPTPLETTLYVYIEI